jgi:hypothetical protein
MRRMSALAGCLCIVCIAGAYAAELKPETVAAFDRYVRGTEARLDVRLRPGAKFLWVDDAPESARQVRAGQILVENRSREDGTPVSGGLIHDWIGAVFIPGVTLDALLARVQDYNHHQEIYQPEVLASRLVSRNGGDFKIYLRLMKKKVITVVLDTDHDVHYVRLDAARCYSRSYTTRITEVEHPGARDERALPPGEDQGFLWRLDSYWRFEERDGGVYVECEAVSLTRTAPAGLGWLIGPFIRTLPRESLGNTLRETRAAFGK